MKLTADADERTWLDLATARGGAARRQRKKAVAALVELTRAQMGLDAMGGRFGGWLASRVARGMLERADGRMLVWSWRDDPELALVIVHAVEATAQVRTARASSPIEYDDTEDFPNPFLGVGEKLVFDHHDRRSETATATYTWDTGTHLIVLSAICFAPSRFGVLLEPLDDLARTVRVDEPTVLVPSDPFELPPS